MAAPHDLLEKSREVQASIRQLGTLCRTLMRERDERESECRTLRAECAALKAQNEQLRLLLERDAKLSSELLTKLKP